MPSIKDFRCGLLTSGAGRLASQDAALDLARARQMAGYRWVRISVFIRRCTLGPDRLILIGGAGRGGAGPLCTIQYAILAKQNIYGI